MANETILAKGIRIFEKHEKAPDFVIGTMIITFEELKDFFIENQKHVSKYEGKTQLKFQLLRSKEGKPYCSLDTYKPEPKAEKQQTEDIPGTDDLPF